MKEARVLLVVSLTVVMLAQEKTPITVKETTSASGVIIVTVDLNGKSVDLQCTENMPACARLKTGKYVMVQLPKNRGLYDCQNVDVYSAEGRETTTAQRIGEYCMIQK